VKVIEDPLDPVFVTEGPSPGKVEIQIGDRAGSRYARLTLADARRLARALLDAADRIERKLR
jgi:hypothetical protein